MNITPLDASLVAGGLAAFGGALAGVLTIGGRMPARLAAGWQDPGTPPLTFDQRLTIGAFLLASHAITAAALWQAHTLGASLAAGLGAGWIGAAAAGLVGMMGNVEKVGQRAGAVAFRAALGFALLAPLWAYVQLIHLHVMANVPA